MLSPHIIRALLAQREADLQRSAELARLRRPGPAPEPAPEPFVAPAGSGTAARHRGRRRHLRLV